MREEESEFYSHERPAITNQITIVLKASQGIRDVDKYSHPPSHTSQGIGDVDK